MTVCSRVSVSDIFQSERLVNAGENREVWQTITYTIPSESVWAGRQLSDWVWDMPTSVQAWKHKEMTVLLFWKVAFWIMVREKWGKEKELLAYNNTNRNMSLQKMNRTDHRTGDISLRLFFFFLSGGEWGGRQKPKTSTWCGEDKILLMRSLVYGFY